MWERFKAWFTLRFLQLPLTKGDLDEAIDKLIAENRKSQTHFNDSDLEKALKVIMAENQIMRNHITVTSALSAMMSKAGHTDGPRANQHLINTAKLFEHTLP